jgi:voltage-gated potassium channel Kch
MSRVRSGAVPLRVTKALHDGPVSVRRAMQLIVAATVVTTLVGAVIVWIADERSFDGFGDAVWWALQTVTTVGYGDVTPKNAAGRIVGALILLYSVAFLALLTAAITTSFIERARRDREELDRSTGRSQVAPPDLAAVLSRLDQIDDRLARLEQLAGGRDEA